MSNRPAFSDFQIEDVLCGVLDLARGDQQIGCRHQADELRNQQPAALDVVVNAHAAIVGRFGRHAVYNKFRRSDKVGPNHLRLLQHPRPDETSRHTVARRYVSF